MVKVRYQVIFLLTLFLTTFASVAKAQEQYSNSEKHFTFTLPQGWESVPKDELSDEELKVFDKKPGKKELLAVCRPEYAEPFEPPFMIVRFSELRDYSEIVLEKVVQSDESRQAVRKRQEILIKALQRTEGYFPESWKDAERVATNSRYDSKLHALFSEIELYNEVVGPIALYAVTFAGNHRVILFTYYIDGDDVETLPELIDETVHSFRYDKGYEFGAGDNMSSRFIKKFLSGRNLLSIFGPFIIISIVIGVLKHWAEN